MRNFFLLLAVALGVVAFTMNLWSNKPDETSTLMAEAPGPGPGEELATFGAGCFWCTEAVLAGLDGVKHVTSGYMGGHLKTPTYKDVCTGETGHAEVVQVVFDPAKISYAGLLDWFWKLHDPTQKDRQGNDHGTQYRSAIFFHSEAQAKTARESMAKAQLSRDKPIATEIVPAVEFYPAEKYHQEYYRLNKDKNPYCTAIITPKLKKLGLE